MGHGQSHYWVYMCIALAGACSVDKHRTFGTGKGGAAGDSGTAGKAGGGSSTAGAGSGGAVSAGGKGGANSVADSGAGGGNGGTSARDTTHNSEGGTDGSETGGAGGSATQPPKGEPCEAEDGTYECLETAGKTRRACRGGYWEEGDDCGAKQNCDSRDGSCKEIVPQCVAQTPGFRFCDDSSHSLTCGPDLVSTESTACTGKCVQGQCAPVSCGDGVKQAPEECDDGNTVDTDDCTSGCKSKSCGDGFVQSGEACDDGNTTPADGCTSCQIDNGYGCTGAPSSCTAKCGDGIVVSGKEACDDGNSAAGDGCVSCQVASGYSCAGSPSSCSTKCGDGIVVGTETCDDNNTSANDGCSASCKAENGYTCTGAPSRCAVKCGDKIVVSGKEDCDDGNAVNDDGCKNDCTLNRFQVFKPPANFDLWVYDTSEDGTVVVGRLSPWPATPQNGFQSISFRWSQSTGLQAIADVECVQGLKVSGDGATLVGNSVCPNVSKPFVWSVGASASYLWGDWESLQGTVTGISASGAVIVGSYTTNGRPFRWDSGTRATLKLPNGVTSGLALAIGADGGVAVGGTGDYCFEGGASEGTVALRWVGTGAPTVIPAPSGFACSFATAVNRDGSVVYGTAEQSVFKWTSDGGSVVLKSGAVTGQVTHTSNDGKFALGHPQSGESDSWLWDDNSQQLRSVKEILVGLGVKWSDWTGMAATGLSDDGKVIVGVGTSAGSAVRTGWIARFR